MDFAALIPIAGISAGVAIMWICYKYQEVRVMAHRSGDEAARETAEQIEALRTKDTDDLRSLQGN